MTQESMLKKIYWLHRRKERKTVHHSNVSFSDFILFSFAERIIRGNLGLKLKLLTSTPHQLQMSERNLIFPLTPDQQPHPLFRLTTSVLSQET